MSFPLGRGLMVVGAATRFAYGLGALWAPLFTAGRLAAADPESVMNLRGFGGQNLALGVCTLLAARSSDLARPALLLNLGVDICDATAGALEVRERAAGVIPLGHSPARRGLCRLAQRAADAGPLTSGS